MMEHLPNISIHRNGVDIKLDLTKFNGRFKDAQYFLDNEVMTSMLPIMPMITGTFKNITQAESRSLAGSGTVIAAAAPMGRFLYMGKLMIGEHSRSPWAQLGEKKVVTDVDLRYSNPAAHAMWFEEAKVQYADKWTDGVARILGGYNG